jgi:hypothetical protein
MTAAILLRDDFDGSALRRLARQSRDAGQTRRLLALAAIYDGGSRSDAARTGGVGVQIKSGRLGRLIEYDPAYCDVILRRFEAMTGASAILARTGQTFEDVAAACTQPETSHDPNEGSSATTGSGEYVQ